MTKTSAAADLCASIAETTDIDSLTPQEFTRAVASELDVLALEHGEILVRISRRNAPFFAGNIRWGMTARLRENLIEMGMETARAERLIDPNEIILANRIQSTVLLNESVTLSLPQDEAIKVADALRRGLARFPATAHTDTKQEVTPDA